MSDNIVEAKDGEQGQGSRKSGGRRGSRSRSRPSAGGNSRSVVKNAPTSEEIIILASKLGYRVRRPEVSRTIFLISEDGSVKVNIFYTTRSVMTHLTHPKQDTNQLWRSHAYSNLDELEELLKNPRKHTDKGYRSANKAVRGCVECGRMKKRTDFSKHQWVKGPDLNRCLDCVAAGKTGENANDADPSSKVKKEDNEQTPVDEISFHALDLTSASESEDTSDDDFPRLTAQSLQQHNLKIKSEPNDTGNSKVIRDEMERRQFNCPLCPKHGRGPYVFYKKVPIFKPVVKCPKCKRVTRGKCKRLHPVPKEQERGYGFFMCIDCGDKWGSSRAVPNVGQYCFTCRDANANNPEFVPKEIFPFRMEVFRPWLRRRVGGKPMARRVPKEPIKEEIEERPNYTPADEQRHRDAGRNALARSNDRAGRDVAERSAEYGPESSYSFEPASDRPRPENSTPEHPRPEHVSSMPEHVPSISQAMDGKIPKGYSHLCAGCASGLCKTRHIPKSQIHDVSDGITVSTKASVVTNSSFDKTDFVDRDPDPFSGFEDVLASTEIKQ